jgi:hypothetical protein
VLDGPVVVFDQILVVPQQVVVEIRHLPGEEVGLFDGPDDLDQTTVVEVTMQTVGDRRRGARMSTASVRCDDQNALRLCLDLVAQRRYSIWRRHHHGLATASGSINRFQVAGAWSKHWNRLQAGARSSSVAVQAA